MGRVVAPYGVKGWLKVAPLSEAPETLLSHATWWMRRKDGEWHSFALESGRMHGNTLVAKLGELPDRETAAAFAGGDVGVARSALPAIAQNEVYWADLVGLSVVNREGELLGTVSAVREYGAHPVLQVQGDDRERLVPFVEAYVDGVDVAGGRIEVDWHKDY